MAFCWPLDNPSFSFCCSVENEQELLDQQQMLKRKEVRPLSGPVSPLFSSTWCCHPLIPQLLCLFFFFFFFCLFPVPRILLPSSFPSASLSRSRINLVHSLLGRFIRDLDIEEEGGSPLMPFFSFFSTECLISLLTLALSIFSYRKPSLVTNNQCASATERLRLRSIAARVGEGGCS